LSAEGIQICRNKTLFFLCFFVFFCSLSFCQDLKYVKKYIKKLTSQSFFGRGYTNDGDLKAANFIRNELKNVGVKPLAPDYFQEYSFSVNIFPGEVNVSIDNKELIPGTDFCIRASSPEIHGTFDIVKLDTSLFNKTITEDIKVQLANKFGSYDTIGWGNRWYQYFFRSKNQLPYMGTIQKIDKTPKFGVSSRQSKEVAIIVNQNATPGNAEKIKLDIQSKVITHKANNVIGLLPGNIDTFIVFTAHYDHLGGLGKSTYFPGANDNASGTAMVLDFARELSKQKNHKYGFVFILFSGEEAGLLGSYYFTANPVFPLNKIKMAFNLDMIGTGADGISVFNGKTHPKEFTTLDSLNRVLSLNLNLNSKGISANNDIYPFYKKGVKGFTFLTDEKNAPYHTVIDKFENLTFVSYEKLYRLIKAYFNTL
jgi:aminopeptidase YwaD